MKRNTRLVLSYATLRRHYSPADRKALADEIRRFRSMGCHAQVAARFYGADDLLGQAEQAPQPMTIINATFVDIGRIKHALVAIIANDGQLSNGIDGVLTLTKAGPATWTISASDSLETDQIGVYDDADEELTSPFAP